MGDTKEIQDPIKEEKMIEMIEPMQPDPAILLVQAKEAILDILIHSDQFANTECLAKAKAFIKALDESKVTGGTTATEGPKVP